MAKRKAEPAIDVVKTLLAMPVDQRGVLLRKLSPAQQRELNQRWWLWAHPSQRTPPGDWRVWLIRAGRGFGKTRAGAEWVSQMARENPGAEIALVSGTLDDVRQVMIDGPSGLLAVAHAGERLVWRPSMGTLVFPNGARAYAYSAEVPEKLRGPQHGFAWCDELAKWRSKTGIAAWDNLMMGMRVGERPRVLVTTTPRPVKLMRKVMALPDCHETRGRTRDNRHLPASFVAAMMADYGGTRLGRQELDGEMIDDVQGALWSRDLIERCRVAEAPELLRVVVGVDPPASADGDGCGIVAVGLGRDDRLYVLEDASVGGLSPDGWARAVAACAARHGASRVVAEKNQGGDMVERVLLLADPAMGVALAHAAKNKSQRAEPVSLLYERGRMLHVGAFPALEDELCGLVIGGGYEGPGRSPDRADALVWAAAALSAGLRRGEPGVRWV